MIEKTSMNVFRKFAAGYPVLAVTGPRQSGKMVSADYSRGLKRVSAIAPGARVRPEVIYAGEEESTRDGIPVRPWRTLSQVVAASLR